MDTNFILSIKTFDRVPAGRVSKYAHIPDTMFISHTRIQGKLQRQLINPPKMWKI